MMALPSETRIGAVHLAVADLDGTAAFYRDVLGFRAVEVDGGVSLSASGRPPYDVMLSRVERAPARRRTAGLFHFAILLPDRAHLGRALRHLTAAGAPIEGASDHLVSEAVYLHDPEGNGIEISADRPRERWEMRLGSVVMTTKALDLEDLFANAPGTWEGMPAGTRLGHVHLRVADLTRAEQFYAGVLGFDVMVRGYPGALFVAAGGYHHHIGLNTWAGPVSPADPDRPGLRYFTVVLPDRASLDAALTRVTTARIPIQPSAAGVLVRDPDGIGVMLTN